MKKLIIFSTIGLSLIIWICCTDKEKQTFTEATYTGSDACRQCHGKEYNEYLASDHIKAMDTATSKTVLADFNNSTFSYFGKQAVFTTKQGRFYVTTTDSTGTNKEFEVTHTFGYSPLQQYLVSFSDGRKQVLPFCWDTRPKDQGGQRWFHLYGSEYIAPGDELFWQHYNQTWNYMCADCHTTGLVQNFDIEKNSFSTTYAAQTISCESCHGPASNHIVWTKNQTDKELYKGFGFSLGEKNVSWVMNTATGIAARNTPKQHDMQVQTCARCHSRSIPMTENYSFGHALAWSHIPDNAGPEAFYIDGQQKDEDYEYASFAQSKMYAAGVTCSNCHNPHSGQLIQTGNALCGSCHAPSTFDVEAHTHHAVHTTGATCINCHMPGKNYMQIDYRLDHSIRIPRPDLSAKLGTPDACTQCHSGDNKASIINAFKTWYGPSLSNKPAVYGELLHAIRSYQDSAYTHFNTLLKSPAYPNIMKVSSFQYAAAYPEAGVIQEIQKGLASPDELLRYRALESLENYPVDQVASLVIPMLDDTAPTIRMEAARILAPMHRQLNTAQSASFDAAIASYINIQKKLGSRPEGYMNLGIVYTLMEQYQEAERFYVMGIQRHPMFPALYLNLADLYRTVGNEERSKKTLDAGLARFSSHAALHQALGYWYIRQKDNVKGMQHLQKALKLAPDDPTYAYSYAIGLYSTGMKEESISLIKNFLVKYPNDPTMLNGLISILQGEKLNDLAAVQLQQRRKVFGY
jgi:predicted CXXCH cytochrome family protein